MPDGHTGRIILVRHGETEANRIGCFAASDEVPLTDSGRDQAEVLAHTLKEKFQPVAVYASQFLRARQTAEIVAQAFRLPLAILPGIHERGFGCLKGEPYRRMGEAMRQDSAYDPNKRWLWAPEGGESLETVRVRAIAALESVAALYSYSEIVVVSHGAVMESVTAHLAQDWTNARVPVNCGMLVIPHEHGLLAGTQMKVSADLVFEP